MLKCLLTAYQLSACYIVFERRIVEVLNFLPRDAYA